MKHWIDTEGKVSAISYPGATNSPAVKVHLETAGRPLEIVFLSYRTLHALDIGQTIKVSGYYVERQGICTLYNPRYCIESK